MISTFKSSGWRTISLDYKLNPHSDINLLLDSKKDWNANLKDMQSQLHAILSTSVSTSPSSSSSSSSAPHQSIDSTRQHLSVAIHCAGSWIGGDIHSANLSQAVDSMLDINLKSAVTCAALAAANGALSSRGDGLLVLTGAAAVAHEQATPSMIAYGMSKAATHQLANSLASKQAGIKNATVITLLPTMIDTPTNRSFSSNPSDYLDWTPPADFARLVLQFAQQLQQQSSKQNAPTQPASPPLKNGGFYQFKTKQGKTDIKLL